MELVIPNQATCSTYFRTVVLVSLLHEGSYHYQTKFYISI